MAIFPLNVDQLREALKASSFRYDRFIAEKNAMSKNDDLEIPAAGPEYLYVDAGTVKFQPESEWNAKGRAVWDPADVISTANGVSDALSKLGAADFIALHKYRPASWFQPQDDPSVVTSQKEFLRRNGVEVDLNHWPGGFEIRGHTREFIHFFLDYSHRLRRAPIEIVFHNLPLLLGLDYDLFAYFVSWDRKLLTRITGELAIKNLLFAPSPYLPDDVPD